MRRFSPLFLRATPLLVAAVLAISPALGQEEPEDPDGLKGHDRAVEVITASMNRQIEHLAGLLDEVPEPARQGIEQAMEAMQQGREQALAALAGEPQDPGPEPEPEPEPETADAATGLDRARQALTTSGEQAAAALERAMGSAPEAAQSRLAEAMSQVGAGHARALAALDGLPAPPDVAQARPDRPARPNRPARPDRPEVPQAPERPERPEPTERPDPPERPEPPVVPEPPLP